MWAPTWWSKVSFAPFQCGSKFAGDKFLSGAHRVNDKELEFGISFRRDFRYRSQSSQQEKVAHCSVWRPVCHRTGHWVEATWYSHSTVSCILSIPLGLWYSSRISSPYSGCAMFFLLATLPVNSVISRLVSCTPTLHRYKVAHSWVCRDRFCLSLVFILPYLLSSHCLCRDSAKEKWIRGWIRQNILSELEYLIDEENVSFCPRFFQDSGKGEYGEGDQFWALRFLVSEVALVHLDTSTHDIEIPCCPTPWHGSKDVRTDDHGAGEL